jgi:hypothetical protein
MPSTTPTTSAKHGMTMRNRSPKPKQTGTTSTADNKSNKARKPSKVAKNTETCKVAKITKTNKASKSKIMARYIFAPEALQNLQLYREKSNAQFVDGYLEQLSKQQKAPEKGVEITVSVSEDFEFLQWTNGMMFRDIKFAAEMEMEMGGSEFRMKWDNLE